MKLFSKRLFISDLPPHITEENIKEKFSKFGTVNSIEIKHRKQVTTKNKYPTYAYININTDHYNLQQCFEDFTKNKWKGNYVEIQIAKENFLERLKQERESENLLKSNKKEAVFTETSIEYGKRKRLHFSSDSDNEVAVKKAKEQPKKLDQFKSKSFETKPNDVKILTTNENIGTDTSANNKNETTRNPSDQKRLCSMIEMRKSYQLKRNAVKTALMNVDVKVNNKVIFDDDDYTENKTGNNLNCSNTQNNVPKKGLFEDGDSDENDKEYNFDVKEQFQGKKGKKLMKLQLKFKSDKRFAMDDRFLEDGEISDNELEENDSAQDSKKVQQCETEVTAEEKQKEIAILEGILGGTLVKNKDISKKKSSKSLGMVRYDPTNPQHSKYILKQDQHTDQKPKKKKGEDKSIETYEAEKPIVSKETFYEVKENLKQALEEDKSFSLLTLFNHNKETANHDTVDDVTDHSEFAQKNSFEIKDKNPFQYDSSDENSDNEAQATVVEQEKELYPTEDKHNGQKISLGPTKLWRESFFFKEDDYRFQEGIDFVKKFALDDKTEFKEVRRNIKEIVRAKVRNNQRKNKLFKKKLGGRRIARMKKAIKNR